MENEKNLKDAIRELDNALDNELGKNEIKLDIDKLQNLQIWKKNVKTNELQPAIAFTTARKILEAEKIRRQSHLKGRTISFIIISIKDKDGRMINAEQITEITSQRVW